MSVLRILKYPETSLTTPSAEIDEIDEEIHTLIRDMGDTMFDAPGVGLAAPQVGVNKRVIVYNHTAGQSDENGASKEFSALINPSIIKASGSQVSEDEGCLSVPDLTCNVNRYEKVTVTGMTPEGKKVEFDAEGIPAVIMQHEIDHLDGILFIERISSLKRNMYKKKMKKRHARHEKEV